MHTLNRELLDFIAASPTAFHAAANAAALLEQNGFIRLNEYENTLPEPGGKYYLLRNGSALIAFRMPEETPRGFMLMAAHTDSPSFKIKENCDVSAAGLYTVLNVEKYGGMLCASWMDRPLSAAGRLVVRDGARLKTVNVNIDKDLFVIPNVAIHMDRSANEGKEYNPNVDMLPLIGGTEAAGALDRLAAEAAGVQAEDIAGKDLFLYPRTPGTVWGAADEFISAPRLDDLQCVFACLKGFLGAGKSKSVSVFCAFDNEEVGSGTKQGADSCFLEDTLERIAEAVRLPLRVLLANSFMVSADNAHAVHPNHPEHADRNDRPKMNGGIVVKYHAGQSYTTDSVSAAVFESICSSAGVPVQRFTNRADKRGGSTLGHISSAHVSVDSVDIGLAQLAMHSAWETAGAEDTMYLIKAAETFYAASFYRTEEGIEL